MSERLFYVIWQLTFIKTKRGKNTSYLLDKEFWYLESHTKYAALTVHTRKIMQYIVYIYIYVYVHTHTHTHTHIYIYIYIYIYIIITNSTALILRWNDAEYS